MYSYNKILCNYSFTQKHDIKEKIKKPRNWKITFHPYKVQKQATLSHCFYLVAKSCPTLLQPHGLQPTRLLCPGFPRQELRSGLPFPSPEDLPNPGIELASPALASEFFTTELPVKPNSKLQMLAIHVGGKTIMRGRTCLTETSGWWYLQREGGIVTDKSPGVLGNALFSNWDGGLLYKFSLKSMYVSLCRTHVPTQPHQNKQIVSIAHQSQETLLDQQFILLLFYFILLWLWTSSFTYDHRNRDKLSLQSR